MNETANRIKEQVGQIQEVYESGGQALGELAKSASESSKKAINATDQWVQANPWLALGVVAGVGVLLGVLVAQTLIRDD